MAYTIISKWKDLPKSVSPMVDLVTEALEDLELGKPSQACDKFKRVTWEELSREEETEGHYLFGVALSQSGYYTESENEFRLALDGTSEDSKVMEAWGIALYDAGKDDNAALKFQAALTADPNNWSALYNWGNLLVNRGEYDTAIEKYKTALNFNEDDLDLIICLGHVYCLKEEYHIGEEWFKQGIELYPEESLLQVWLGNAMDMQGRSDEALAVYQAATRMDPFLPDAYEQWGLVLHRLGRSSEALLVLEQGLLHVPREPGLCLSMAQILLDLSRFYEALSMAEGAVAELELAEEEYSDEELLSTAHYTVGKILETLGEKEEALEHYYMSVVLSPFVRDGFESIAAIRGIYRENHWMWDAVVSMTLQEEETEYKCFQSFKVAALDEREVMKFIKEYLERTSGEYLSNIKLEESKRQEQLASYAGILAASEKISVEDDEENNKR